MTDATRPYISDHACHQGARKSSSLPVMRIVFLAAVAVFVVQAEASAYIGPGAGFAALGSFLVMFLAMVSAVVTLFTWPIRYLIRMVRRRRAQV